MGITILGLGPGDRKFLTQEAEDALAKTETLYLRTSKHPGVKELPKHLELISFDYIYEQENEFHKVYQRIADEITSLAGDARSNKNSICYAVPGHPLIGETTTSLIIDIARATGIPIRVIAGISFIEPALTALNLDALEGLQLFDALEIIEFRYPPINGDIGTMIGQVYSRHIASALKLTLMAIFPDEHQVFLVHAAGTADEQLESLPLYLIDRSQNLSYLTTLFLPSFDNSVSLNALSETIAILRGPEGCPWDQEQTPQSLRSGLLEEASEVLSAIDSEDIEALEEELGDLLYHIVMQCQIASEEELFNVSTVIAGIDSKLRRRHPHVWGDVRVDDSSEVLQNWEMLKKGEKDQPASLMDNLPNALPSLSRAQLIQERAATIGFDWSNLKGVVSKVHEEIAELDLAKETVHQEREYGDLIFSLVNLARWHGINAEIALREANKRFIERFRILEQMAANEELDLTKLDIDHLESLWQRSKQKADSRSE